MNIVFERLLPVMPYDPERINELIQNEFQGRQVIDAGSLRAILNNPLYFMIVARDGDHIVGICNYIISQDMGRWICGGYNISVDPKYRRRGIAKGLLETGHTFLRDFGRTHDALIGAYVNMNPSRVATNDLHLKQGWEKISEAVGPHGTNFYKRIMYDPKL